jgi:pSer/pThr/pTyr-binding forkhead associated (FHA) protein
VNSQRNLEETWPALPAVAPSRLVLTWGAHEVEVTDRRPLLTIGRGVMSDMVIKDDKVSRLHARIEYRNAHFSLTDLSGNGTFVTDSAGTAYKVNNDTHVLLGTGSISFGIDPETCRPHLIKYAVRS